MAYRALLLLVFALPVSAQVYTCKENGKTVFRSSPCDGSMPARVEAPIPTPVTLNTPAAPVARASSPKPYGGTSVAELLNAHARAAQEGDWSTLLALKPAIEHATRMEEIAAGGNPGPRVPKPKNRPYTGMPNGFGGLLCR